MKAVYVIAAYSTVQATDYAFRTAIARAIRAAQQVLAYRQA